MIPMKTQGILDSNLVDDMFYKINEIYMHHATLLAFMERTLQVWNSTTTIGDIIYKNVSTICACDISEQTCSLSTGDIIFEMCVPRVPILIKGIVQWLLLINSMSDTQFICVYNISVG